MNRLLLLSVLVAIPLLSHAKRPTVSSGLLLVANKGDRTLGIIDPDARQQVATVAEGGITGHEVAASPDGQLAFVPIYGNSGVGLPGTDGSTIAVIDIKQHKLIHTIDLGRGMRPHCAVFNAKDGLLYVTTELDQSVTIIDPRSFAIAGRVPTGQPESHMLAISSDGRFGYTANVGPGTISVLDLAARKTLTVIPVAKHIQRIAISPDNRWVVTSDTEKPRLAIVDAAGRKLDHWTELPGIGYGAAFTENPPKWLLIAIPQSNAVAVLDGVTLRVSKTMPVPASPQEIMIAPNGRVAYVSCDKEHTVSAINLTDWHVAQIAAGNGADGLAWAAK